MSAGQVSGDEHVFNHLAWPGLTLLGQEAPPADGGSAILQGPWILFGLLFVLFYFMVWSPERRRRQEHTTMLNSLKKNDVVVTVGGIFGTVVQASGDSEDVLLRIDDSSNTRVRVLRSAVARVIRTETKSDS